MIPIPMFRRHTKMALRLVTVASTAFLTVSYVTAAVAQDGKVTAEPSLAIQKLRRTFMDESVNALTFHSIDSIFYTVPVKAGPNSTNFIKADHALNFKYQFNGKTYAAEDVLERTFTNAMMIVKDDKIIYEKYRNFTGPDTRFLSMSTAKSITSILVGAALEDGLIKSLDDQVISYVPELKGTAFDGASIRDLLLMKSGVDRTDVYRPEPGSQSDKLREDTMIFNRRRTVDEAFLVKRLDRPGQTYRYSTLNTNILGWVLEKATGKPVNEYMSERLWVPMGAQADGFFMTDGPAGIGRPTNGMGFNAVLRDYARIGQMMLHQGRAGNQQIVSADWVKESTVPVGPEPILPTETQGYQYQWWTLVNSNAYTAIGLQGQFIFIDPDTNTVIVKMSYIPLSEREDVYQEIEAFFRAASAWKPDKP